MRGRFTYRLTWQQIHDLNKDGQRELAILRWGLKAIM